MTEVPEYLLERSRQRRVALGLLDADGSGGGDGAPAAGGVAVAEASGPSVADTIAAAKADAKLEAPAPPAAEKPWVTAAKRRHRIPMWALPVVFFLPLWGFVYVRVMDEPPEPVTAISEGASTYAARCASCHGASGTGSVDGGVGRPLHEGRVLLTFPELDDDFISWLRVGSEGIGIGNSYGDPNRQGGARIAGDTGANMPAFEGVLNEHQLYSVARYVREVIGGEVISEEVAAERDAEWEHLGGGGVEGGGGGGAH